jgi:hypothetical protein
MGAILFLKPTSSFLHAGVATIAVEIPDTLSDLFDTAVDGAVVPRLKVCAFFTSPVPCSSRWLTCSWLWLRLSVSSRRLKIRLPETVEIDTVCREKFEIGDMRYVRDSVSLN